MIDSEYKRDMYRSYLIICANSEKNNCYALKMLLVNKVDGLLQMELKTIDNINQYYYDVTMVSPLNRIYDKKQMDYIQVAVIIRGILNAIKNSKRYLLEENDFVLLPEYIFLQEEKEEIQLCYLPGYDTEISFQLAGFIEYLMNKVNHKDEKAVILVYGLYKISKEDCSLEHMYGLIEHEDSSNVLNIKGKAGQEKIIEEKKTYRNIPIMQEKIEDEEEIKVYDFNTYVLAAGIAICSFFLLFFLIKSGVLNHSFNNHISWKKVILVVGVMGSALVYAYLKVFSPENKITKVISKVKYIGSNELQEQSRGSFASEELNLHEERKTVLLSEECRQEKTVLLAEREGEEQYILDAAEENQESAILLTKFPFYIGKKYSSVDYIIDNHMISRIHAKIEKEGDKFYLTDMDSTNGTFVNNIRRSRGERTEIYLGDEIRFAHLSYRFHKMEK